MGQAVGSGRLEDRYYLQKVKLGQGSFGTVWRAIDRETNGVVAIKQIDKAAMPRRGVRRQDIDREIHVMQAVRHANITRLLGFFEDQQSIYLALEYCDGGDFGDKVRERGLDLTEGEAAEWMHQILAAIECLHDKDICHRDIKPDNFMVHSGTIKLSDFGLALFLPAGRLLTEKCGTPAFMAPEQHKLPRGSRGYMNGCDVWAAGVTMYMLMFGGRHPFLGYGNKLDDRRLLSGTLDFNAGQGFLGFAMLAEPRYSHPARSLCSRLVEPDPDRRLTARSARQDLWFRLRPAAAGGDLQRAPTMPLGQVGSWQPEPPAAGFPGHQRPMAAAGVTTLERQDGRGGQVAESEGPELRKQIEVLQRSLRLQQEQNESQLEVVKHLQNELRQGYTVEPPRHVLPVGTRCRYHSSSFNGWLPATISGFNEDDGTYNLDVRQHARVEDISPAPDVSQAEAWPPGTLVLYESTSVRQWLPGVVRSYNEHTGNGEGTYNLDLRDNAAVERMRPRLH